jgi:hypothetical protein
VLDETRGADYTIWLVALLLYVSDAAKLLAPRELLLVEAGRRRLAASFSEHPFTLAGRVLAFSPLLLPQRGVFVAPWGSAWSPETALRATLESIERLRGSLRFVRALAMWAFAVLFVAGPGLTLWLGTSAAVFYTAATLYPTTIVAVVWLWWRRRALGLTAGRAARVSAEILLCPGFLPNLVRKITGAQPVTVDAAQILAASASPSVRQGLLTRLERRTEELIEAVDPEQPEAVALRAYLATVRATR